MYALLNSEVTGPINILHDVEALVQLLMRAFALQNNFTFYFGTPEQ